MISKEISKLCNCIVTEDYSTKDDNIHFKNSHADDKTYHWYHCRVVQI